MSEPAGGEEMDWVLAHCDCLRTKLQNVLDGGAAGSAREFGARRGLRVPWSWACRWGRALPCVGASQVYRYSVECEALIRVRIVQQLLL